MTTTDDVQAAIVTALTNATDAQARVYTPRTWPVAPEKFPILFIQSPSERKVSKGKNAPAYDVFSTIRVIARYALKATADDQSAKAVLTELSTLQRQIEVAVVNNYRLYLIISEISDITIANDVKSEGDQSVGELTIDFVCVFYQGAEVFAPNETAELEELDLTVSTYPPPEPSAPSPGFVVSLVGEYNRVTDAGDSRTTDDGLQRITDF